MVKKIYLIRHGQTDFNLKGIVQGGRVDTSLNATGIQQSAQFFEKYKDIAFDKVYTSTLKRSIQSVQQFIDLGIPHEAFDGLNEISWGEKDGTIVTAGDNAFYWNMIKAWSEGDVDAKIPGGESPAEVKTRQQKVIETIFSRSKEKTILICMHGRAIRILLTLLLNYDLTCMDQFEHQNLGLYVLTCTGSLCTVEVYNDGAHLQSLSDKLVG